MTDTTPQQSDVDRLAQLITDGWKPGTPANIARHLLEQGVQLPPAPKPAAEPPNYHFLRARGAIKPAPGSPPSEVLIRRARDAGRMADAVEDQP